jgi:hypothetical protein
MGRDFQPPEQADSWGEFHARLEWERTAAGNGWTGLWWAVAGLLFGVGLISSAYALQYHHWWLWVAMLTPLAIVGVMAVRAADRADRARERAGELNRLEDAWLAHLERHSPRT